MPPKHLTKESQKLFRTIVRDYEIDPAAGMILTATLEARDRREQARAALVKTGPVYKDRFGQWKPVPLIAIERDAAAIMMKGWRLLGFDQEPRGEHGIPR